MGGCRVGDGGGAAIEAASDDGVDGEGKALENDLRAHMTESLDVAQYRQA